MGRIWRPVCVITHPPGLIRGVRVDAFLLLSASSFENGTGGWMVEP